MRRCELIDKEWRVIQPLLPSKPRGVPRVGDRRVMDGICDGSGRAPRGAACPSALAANDALHPLHAMARSRGLGPDFRRGVKGL